MKYLRSAAPSRVSAEGTPLLPPGQQVHNEVVKMWHTAIAQNPQLDKWATETHDRLALTNAPTPFSAKPVVQPCPMTSSL